MPDSARILGLTKTYLLMKPGGIASFDEIFSSLPAALKSGTRGGREKVRTAIIRGGDKAQVIYESAKVVRLKRHDDEEGTAASG